MKFSQKPRNFLVVVDESPEMRLALIYASHRAKKVNGIVTLLYVVAPIESQQWLAVEESLKQEKLDLAHATLEQESAEVMAICGRRPIVHLREGLIANELLALLEEVEGISIVVLATSTSPEKPRAPGGAFVAAHGLQNPRAGDPRPRFPLGGRDCRPVIARIIARIIARFIARSIARSIARRVSPCPCPGRTGRGLRLLKLC